MRILTAAAGAAFLILAATPVMAGGPNGGCGGGCGGGGHPGGGWRNVNVNVNSNANANANANAYVYGGRSVINARSYVRTARYSSGGNYGGTSYVGGGGGGDGYAYYGGPIYNEAPYQGSSCRTGPYGYVLGGFG
ncbi:MAG TPA: hypothetical protein VLZ73_04375, partial [Brevundimonas sp.]|nr:hypothetical protein [Brevundimonas sp.]